MVINEEEEECHSARSFIVCVQCTVRFPERRTDRQVDITVCYTVVSSFALPCLADLRQLYTPFRPLRSSTHLRIFRIPIRRIFLFYFLKVFYNFIVTYEKFGSPYPGKVQQPQEKRYPFLSLCIVFSVVQTMIWLSVFGIFFNILRAHRC